MVLTHGAVRFLRQAGKMAGIVMVVAALALGTWLAIGAVRGDGNSARAGGPPLLIYSEFGHNSDTIWAAQADDPTQRTRLTSVDHAPEYGIVATLSPDNEHIAYNVLPPTGSAAIDAPAELWVMDRDGGNPSRLAVDVDLPVPPIWSPDGSSIVFRRSTGDDFGSHFQLIRVTMSGTENVLLDSTEGLMPVGFGPGGSLYFASLSAAGTDLGVVYSSGGVIFGVAHLSDDFARDWHLSPDGSRLAYLSPQQNADGTSYGAVVLNLKVTAASVFRSMAIQSNQGDEFNPIWRPDGKSITVGRIQPQPQLGQSMFKVMGAGTIESVPTLPQGFDVPLVWSPDAGFLAVRFYESQSITDPGRSWVTVVGSDGTRRTVSPNSDVEVMGWVDSGG
jgi:dipeptidyl aminopeptidase/acylaminoacyl peptidase